MNDKTKRNIKEERKNAFIEFEKEFSKFLTIQEDNKINELIETLENFENFTICEALYQSKNVFDLLCITNYTLGNIINLTRYELETEEQKRDFEELKKIKDKILIIKNKNV